MDIFGSIILLVVLSVFFLGTLNSLYEGGYFILREWWDDDYRKFRKTLFLYQLQNKDMGLQGYLVTHDGYLNGIQG